MDKFEQKIHRTWVQLLIEHDFKEVAAIAIDADVTILYDDVDSSYGPHPAYGIAFDIPTSAYSLVKKDDHIREIMERAIRPIVKGQVSELIENFTVEFRIKLIEVEEGWQETVRRLIVRSGDPNQGFITEKAFLKQHKQPYLYNEIKFASKSEIRIAQEFETQHILFFPLPLAVRAETGNKYQDHREVDFLVCYDGVWGILEVSYHPDRFEKDAEKDSWFKKSGILCIQHYSAERCYNTPKEVANEFLEILKKHKK